MFLTSWLSAVRKGFLRVSSKPARRRPRQSYGQYACEMEVLEERLMLTNFAVNDDWAGLDDGTLVTYQGNDYTIGTTAFSTIQAGVNATDPTDGDGIDTVFVAAGTYNESVNISKAVDLEGANAGIAYDGTRGEESTVTASATIAFNVTAANVTIDGFSISGQYGVYASGGDLSDLTVSNNLIEGTARALTLSADVAADNISVSGNKLDSSTRTLQVDGAADFTNLSVTNNQFTGDTPAASGIFFSGYTSIDGFTFSDNDVQQHANFASNISNGLIDNNTFNISMADTFAVEIQAHDTTISNNTFEGNGVSSGLHVWGSQYGLDPSSNVTISGNTFTDTVVGFESSLDVTNITLDGNSFDSPEMESTAILISGGSVSVLNNSIHNVTNGIVVTDTTYDGTTQDVPAGTYAGHLATATGNLFDGYTAAAIQVSNTGTVGTISNNSFSGTADGAVAVDNETANTIDASGNWWGTNVESEIQALLIGSVDYSPWLNAGTNLVLPGETGFNGDFLSQTVSAASPQASTKSAIQEAIDLATEGGTIYVLAGLYTAAPGAYVGYINKSLTLLGAQAGTDARNRTGEDESIIQGTTVGLFAAADNVTIDGFTLTSDAAATQQKIGIQTSGLFGNYDISNNIITGNTIGLYLNSDDGGALVEHNWIKDNTLTGSAGQNGIYSDQGLQNATINENLFAGNPYAAITLDSVPTGSSGITITNNVSDATIQVHRMSDVTITGNTITDPSGAGIYIGGGVSGADIGGNTIALDDTVGPGAVVIANEYGFGANSDISIHNNLIDTTANRAGVVVDSANIAYDDTTSPLLVNENAFLGTGIAINNNNSTAMQLDADNNYWGTSDPTAVQARIVGTQAASVDFSVLLDNGVDADLLTPGFQADFSSLTVHDLGIQIEAISRIQEAVIEVTAGGTIHVAPGVYYGDVTIAEDTPVTILGAQQGVDAYTRNSTGELDLDAPVQTESIVAGNFKVLADNVTVDGLAFSFGTNQQFSAGNNSTSVGTLLDFQLLNSLFTWNETNTNPQRQLMLGSATVADITLANNAFFGTGDWADTANRGIYLVVGNGGMTGLSIDNNHITGFRDGIFEGGVIGNVSLSLTDNTVTNNITGVNLGHINTPTITGNTFSGNSTGLQIGATGGGTVSGNTFLNNTLVASGQVGVGFDLFGGQWGTWTNDGLQVFDNTFTGNNYGLLVRGGAGGETSADAINIHDNDFNANGVGIWLKQSGDGTDVFSDLGYLQFSNITINGSTAADETGVLVQNVTGPNLDLGNMTFNGNLEKYIGYTHVGVTPLPTLSLDATGATFAGVLASVATNAQQFAIVNKITDGVDVDGFGLVRTRDGAVFVTSQSYSSSEGTFLANIQRGIDVADSGDTVFVNNGLYFGNLTLDKPVNLIGAGSNFVTVISTATSTPVLYVNTTGTETDPLIIQGMQFLGASGTTGNLGSGILVDGSSAISYLTFNDIASTSNSGSGLAFNNTGTLSHVLVENSNFTNNGQHGIRIATGVGLIDDLVFDNIAADNNFLSGITVYGSPTNSVRDVTIENSSFDGNGTSLSDQGKSVVFYNIDGDASHIDLTNVTVNESTTNANLGIFFKGIVDAVTGEPLSGTSGIHLTNVTVSGTLNDYGGKPGSNLLFKDFTEVNTTDPATFNNVQLNAAATVGIMLANVPNATFSADGLVFGSNLDHDVAYDDIDEINLTDADDTAILSIDPNGHLILTVNGGNPILLEGITSLKVNGLAGNDRLIVNQAGGNVFTLLTDGVDFDGGAGLQNAVAIAAPGASVDYTPSGTVAGSGSVSLEYEGEDPLDDILTFTQVAGLAVTSADEVYLLTPDGGDTLAISNVPPGLPPEVPADAVGVAGTVGAIGSNPGVTMASLLVWDIGALIVDTGYNNDDTDGAADTVNIATLATTQVENLVVYTTDIDNRHIANPDTVNIVGPVSGLNGLFVEASHLNLAGSISTTPGNGDVPEFVALYSNTGLTQTAGVITTANLVVLGSGNFTLNGSSTGNNIQNLYADVDGDLQFQNQGGFTVGGELSEGDSPAIDTNGHYLQLWSQTGAITIADGIVADGATVVLLSNGAYESTPEGTITAGSLLLAATGTGNFTLSQGNQVSNFAATTSGSLYFLNNLVTTVTTVNGISGVSSTAGNVQLVTGPQLILEQGVTAASGTVTLQSYGGVSQESTGTVSAQSLLLLGAGDYDLSAASNAVNTLAGMVNGSVSYNNTNTFQVGTVGGVAGINTQGHDLTLSSDGFLLISQAIIATNAVVTLDVNGAYESAAAATITAGSLALSGAGDFTLSQANKVSNFASSTSGSLYFLNNLVTTVTTVNGITGVSSTTGNVQLVTGPQLILEQGITATSGTVTLQSYGGVSQGADGEISAQNLLLNGAGDYDLSAANAVGTLAGSVNGSIAYLNTGALLIGTVNGVSGINTQGHDLTYLSGGFLTISQAIVAANANVTLISGGALESTTQATITAAGLALGAFGAGDFTLSQKNQVSNLAASINGNLYFLNNLVTTVSTVGLVTGVSTTAGNVQLVTGPQLILEQGVTASGTVTLQSYGGVSQGADGDVSAQNLLLIGIGNYDLSAAANSVGTFAGTVTGSINYNNAGAFQVGTVGGIAGINTQGNSLTLSSGGLITISQAIVAANANVTLQSAGALESTASGTITASHLQLTGTGEGDFTLSQLNDVNNLTGTTQGDVDITDVDDLTVGIVRGEFGLSTGGGDFSLLASHVIVNGTINTGIGSTDLALSGTVGGILEVHALVTSQGEITLQGTAGKDLIVLNADISSSVPAQLLGGAGADIFMVRPSTTTVVNVDGTAPSSDNTLIYNFPSGDPVDTDTSLLTPGYSPITYSNIGSVLINPDQAALNAAFAAWASA